MWSRSSANLGARPCSGGRNVAAQPTCICAFALSTARNESSSADRRVPLIATLDSLRFQLRESPAKSLPELSGGPLELRACPLLSQRNIIGLNFDQTRRDSRPGVGDGRWLARGLRRDDPGRGRRDDLAVGLDEVGQRLPQVGLDL